MKPAPNVARFFPAQRSGCTWGFPILRRFQAHQKKNLKRRGASAIKLRLTSKGSSARKIARLECSHTARLKCSHSQLPWMIANGSNSRIKKRRLDFGRGGVFLSYLPESKTGHATRLSSACGRFAFLGVSHGFLMNAAHRVSSFHYTRRGLIGFPL